MEKFGREHFKETTDAIETAERSLQENTEITSELKKKLAELLITKETVSKGEIIALAERIEKEVGKREKSDVSLQKAQKRYDIFFEEMRDHAIVEDKLRDILKEAIKKEDYEGIIEIAERLKRHDTLKKDPEKFDMQGTQELYEKFASQFKYIGGLVEGKALAQLDNDRYAFIDHNDKIVSKEYKRARSYSEGKAPVQLDNDRRVFIDHNDKIVSKEYKWASSYSEDKAPVQLDNNRWVFIDHNDKIVSKEYEWANSYSESKALAQLDNNRRVFIDHDGKIINFKK